jgi:hypothetical protein
LDYFWPMTTVSSMTETHCTGDLSFCNCRMSAIHPTSVIGLTLVVRCTSRWHFGSCTPPKSVPSYCKAIVTQVFSACYMVHISVASLQPFVRQTFFNISHRDNFSKWERKKKNEKSYCLRIFFTKFCKVVDFSDFSN